MQREFPPDRSALTVNPIFTLAELGLDSRIGLEQASQRLIQISEAQIVRWVQFPSGALFFTLVPDDPESGAVYIFDRREGVFYLLDFADQKWGGYSLPEYETLERTYRLSLLAQRPWLLRRWTRPSRSS
jgi:hypothetical protein